MAVSCKRVGCRVPATTTVVIDPQASKVTLIDVELSPIGVTLCSVHASVVTPPMHWVLVDERDADLRLLPRQRAEAPPPPDPQEPAPAPAARRPRRRVAANLFAPTEGTSDRPPTARGRGRGRATPPQRDAG